MSTCFDPFRFNQTHEPDPVEGPILQVRLVDDDEEPLVAERSSRLRSAAALVSAAFVVSTCWSFLRHLIAD